MVTKVRIEPFGALVHNTKTAITAELNREEARQHLNFQGTFPDYPKGISAPRVVHLELTNQCNLDPTCYYCYVDKESKEPPLSTLDWTTIILKLAKAGVFQITFGGGEPTLRRDLGKLARFANRYLLNLGMTTNGKGIGLWYPSPSDFKFFDQVNVSFHASLVTLSVALKTIDFFTRTGINFVCDSLSLPFLDDIVNLIKGIERRGSMHGPPELLLLSLKPQLVEHIGLMIPTKDIQQIALNLLDQGISVALDSYTCNICEGGYSFCDISHTGEVYPCSFVRTSYGNILEESFLDIWKRMPAIAECPFKGY